MTPLEAFKFCPACGRARPAGEPRSPFHCAACGFHYYFNPTVAVAALLVRPDGQALFIRRARPPAQGRLALAGGFIDIGETAEAALRREVREEVNLEIGPCTFLGSWPNAYEYRGITYPVLDLIFHAPVADSGAVRALDGVRSFAWLDPLAVDPASLAFPSMQEGLRLYQTRAAAQR